MQNFFILLATAFFFWKTILASNGADGSLTSAGFNNIDSSGGSEASQSLATSKICNNVSIQATASVSVGEQSTLSSAQNLNWTSICSQTNNETCLVHKFLSQEGVTINGEECFIPLEIIVQCESGNDQVVCFDNGTLILPGGTEFSMTALETCNGSGQLACRNGARIVISLSLILPEGSEESYFSSTTTLSTTSFSNTQPFTSTNAISGPTTFKTQIITTTTTTTATTYPTVPQSGTSLFTSFTENSSSTARTSTTVLYTTNAAIDSSTVEATSSSSTTTTTSATETIASTSAPSTSSIPNSNSYWVGEIKRQGQVPFINSATGYNIYRNVQDFGAKGDGVTDDTDAINQAISSGGRCGSNCNSSTLSPAIVYFPAGTYLVSKPIIQYYFTQFIGDALNLPVLKASSSFKGIAVIDTDPYMDGGAQWYTNQNNFLRQVRNFVIDLTSMPSNLGTGIHWQVAQATSLQNIIFKMVKGGSNNLQQGIWMENGSGGFMTDLYFEGGNFGAWVGNQQFTTRNMTFEGCKTAIFVNWNWLWQFKSLTVSNCEVGIDMSSGGESSQSVGIVMLQDSIFENTNQSIITSFGQGSLPDTGGSLTIDNVDFSGANSAVSDTQGNVLLAGGQKVSFAVQGNSYSGSSEGGQISLSSSVHQSIGTMKSFEKPASLLASTGEIFERSRPQYETIPASYFLSVKDCGAQGDGIADDTAAIQEALNNANGKIVYFDYGAYRITATISVPSNVRITGEMWPLILADGNSFTDVNNPKPMFQVGNKGDIGNVELSDLRFGTIGSAPGAILVEWNVKGMSQGSSGMWDVHFMVGGYTGTDIQESNCAKNEDSTNIRDECRAAFMLLHLTSSSSIYMENNWMWVSDHDLDAAEQTQIDVYNGRGVLIESQGPVWMYGTASEHSTLYNYNLANAQNVYMGIIQTETPYFQSNPDALTPFSPSQVYSDPSFSSCSTSSCKKAWGLYVQNSSNIMINGAGMYSFFDNYDQDCISSGTCQTNVFGTDSESQLLILGLKTIGITNMLTTEGGGLIDWRSNNASFGSLITSYMQE